MGFPICPVCEYPVRRRNRTVHVSCADQVRPTEPEREHEPEPNNVIHFPTQTHKCRKCGALPSREPARSTRECTWCRSTNTLIINGAPFCEAHAPIDDAPRKRSNDVLTLVPDVCERCGEFLTPGVTKGKIKCKCDQPKMPRHLMNNDNDDRPPQQVRYGN